MFNKPNPNSDYKYATDFLKEIIIQLYENEVDKRKILNEVGTKTRFIDEEINSILRESFFSYCRKKGEDPYLLLSAYETHNKRNLSREDNVDDYDFIKFTVDSWEMKNPDLFNQGCPEFLKIVAWNSKKFRYMERATIQRYKALEGSYELVNGLYQYLRMKPYNKHA